MEPLSLADCRRLAALHFECLSDSQVSELGQAYVEAFYRYLARSPFERIFVRREEGQIVSACVLSLRPKSLSRRLLLHTPLAAYALPWFVRGLFKRKTVPVSEPKSGAADVSVPDSLPELILIYTLPGSRSRGGGAALLAQCEQFLAATQHAEYAVRTVDVEGNRALQFYQRNGFVVLGQSTAHGRRFRVFRKPVIRG